MTVRDMTAGAQEPSAGPHCQQGVTVSRVSLSAGHDRQRDQDQVERGDRYRNGG